ncbi:putative ribonuclease H-like domain-containing protein [Tanacetum coccineum]|uniref:Ribonuclease H-like domain-containing protein n=1 Tax=Tanacetum coccineum TaxID=301880 RepID=A0ABQ5J186_9ASTR
MPKSHTRNHRFLPSKSVNARRAADHNRKLNFVDHNQFVIRSLKSVNTKTPQAKHSVNHTKKVWKATRNHNVNTTKTAWRPIGKIVGSVKPQWKPTGRHFALYDNCPLTRIMEPIVEPLELTPSISSSSKVTMISRFPDCKLSDQKAGSKGISDDSQIPALEDIYDHPSDGIFTNASYDDEGTMADFTNLETTVNVSPIPTSRIHSIHPTTQILRDPTSAVQTRSKIHKSFGAHAFIEPKKISQALEDESWREIGTKWVYRNKKDERGVVVINKAMLVAQGYRQEEGIDYDEEVYVSQPPGFVDPKFPKKVYKVVKAMYGLHQAPRAWYATLSTFLLNSRYRRGTIDKTLFIKKDKNDIIFQMSYMGELTFFLGLQVKQKEDGIFISQDKYVAEILKKFDFASVKTASTPIETQKSLTKDEEAADVDVHLYRFMIGSLMYLTASRPDIMYLKGKPKLGLWYPRVSSFDLESYSDSDYARANLDKKSTTGEVEYVAAANYCGQVLWIQNQMLDYGFNFMNTKIYIDNESTICIVKNLVFHSKTKHIEIRHHFIRDAYEKKLIQFWNTAGSQTVNDEKQIHATVDSKTVVVTEASIRSSLLRNDADGTACLTIEAIFQNLALMGKGLKFSGQITPLFSNMLASAKVEEGEGSEQPTESQPTPSPTQPSVGYQPYVTESSSGPDNTHSPSMNLEGTSENKGDQVQLSNDSPHSEGNTSERAEVGLNLEELLSLCTNLSNRVLALETAKDAQAVKILKLKTRIKKLEKK